MFDIPNIWKVSWNKNWYNYNQLIDDYNNQRFSGIICQKKGIAKMKRLPKIKDIVYISCNKFKIMKCIVISDFFEASIFYKYTYTLFKFKLFIKIRWNIIIS